MNYDEIKYVYLQDAKNPGRILTVARKLVPCDVLDTLRLHVGWSLNKQPNPVIEQALHRLESGDYRVLFGCIAYDFDNYDKKAGRRLADERLQQEPLVVDVPAGIRPFDQVLCSLLDHSNYYVRRIVRQYFETNNK